MINEKAYMLGANRSCIRDLFEYGRARATIVGAGVFVEKTYQKGGEEIRARGVRVESLAKIRSMSVENGIEFCD